MSIKTINLTKYYGKSLAIDNINLDIDKGQIVGFIGPNGAGKSTTIKILAGYLEPTSGEVFINGIDIKKRPIEAKKQIGYLPENNPLYTEMYVKEYLEFWAKIHKINNIKSKVEEIIEKTGLTKEAHKKISYLSKGYKQRVGLAAALIHEPDILILDEPTTGLDPNQIIEIRNLIAELGKEKTVILSTHIMQEVEAICQRVIIINNGKIIVDEKTESISNSYEIKTQVFVIEFEQPFNSSRFKEIDEIKNIAKINDNCYIIESTIDVRKTLFNLAVKYNNSILSLQKKEKSLEEIFHELTKK